MHATTTATTTATATIAATNAAPVVRDPARQGHPWPKLLVLAIALAGLASPLITLAGAVIAFALADQEQGTILTGTGLIHMVIGLTFLTGA